MNNQTSHKKTKKFDWEKNLKLLQQVQKENVWVYATRDTEIGLWMKYCRQRKDKLKRVYKIRLQNMGFEWNENEWMKKKEEKILQFKRIKIPSKQENTMESKTIDDASKDANLCPTYEKRVKSSKSIDQSLETINKNFAVDVNHQNLFVDHLKSWKTHWEQEINNLIVNDECYVSTDVFRDNLKSVIDSIPNAHFSMSNASTGNVEITNIYPKITL